ncbi:hypothetical protein OJM13_gp55 [uncultured phage cr82_1]|jgi:hypothetical protein|uniref:Uncharacterized protein n=1 Tax=uncultured phage cr82_1 TaxID=2986416 RepID=A0AAE7S2I9_9CAUD|nr:hypothetical protein OJM13_gp55 [uncultured phage cr82_1]QWM91072.1 hypothetical protein [uncultured phage cr82_1]
MKSITSKYAKNRRDELSKDITKYWTIIKNENIISKETIRNYDLKVLLTKIQEMAEERILMKLYLQCINMGYKKFSDLPAENNYYTIFSLSEKQEQLFHLGKIKTIDPKIKRAKGKKNLNISEELTSAYISNIKNKLQIEINKLNKDLEDFNDKAELDIESAPICLAA